MMFYLDSAMEATTPLRGNENSDEQSKENFNLKLRVFHLEKRLRVSFFPSDISLSLFFFVQRNVNGF